MKSLLILLLCFVVTAGFSAETPQDVVKSTSYLSKQQVSEKDEIVFPCELSENPVENTEIFFYGVNHASEEDREVRELLIAAGQNGDVYVGLEGDHYSDGNIVNWEGTSWNALDIEKSRVFGLEEELVHTLTILPIQHLQLYRAVNDLFGEKSRLSEYKMSFLLDFWSKPLLHKTWRQINRPLFNQEDEKLAVFIDELILIAESREEVFAKLLTVQSHPIWKNDQAFLRLSKRIAKDFISLQAPQLPIEMPDLDIYNAMLENPENLFHEHRFAFEIAVIWRDPSLAKNITRIYCSALKERKSLAVIVGKLHVRSLSRLLTQASLGRVNIVDNSFPE